MTSNKVNIFDFATSELSHDAILCYILSSFNSDVKGDRIISRKLLSHMIGEDINYTDQIDCINFDYENDAYSRSENDRKNKRIYNFLIKQKPIYDTNSLSKVLGFIDIFAELKIKDKNYSFIIEDKIEANEHGNQLKNYKLAEEDKNENPLFVFITFGLKSKKFLSKLMNEGWKIIDKDGLITLFTEVNYEDCSDIIKQYFDYLSAYNMRKEVFKEKTRPINKWSGEGRQGFFSFLEDRDEKAQVKMNIVAWEYVPNQRGGFMGCWFSFLDEVKEEKVKYTPYLQLELSDFVNRIALKISFGDFDENGKSDKSRERIRDRFHREVAKNKWFKVTRRSMGKTITIAEVLLGESSDSYNTRIHGTPEVLLDDLPHLDDIIKKIEKSISEIKEIFGNG